MVMDLFMGALVSSCGFRHLHLARTTAHWGKSILGYVVNTRSRPLRKMRPGLLLKGLVKEGLRSQCILSWNMSVDPYLTKG